MLILFGILVAAITIIIFVLSPDHDAICVARSFGFHCGVNLIYAPLFVKNVRIYRIFRAGAKKIKFISNRTQITFALIVIFGQV